MIQKQINTESFKLEIKLEFKDSDKTDFVYKEGINMIANALVGAIHSGELFSLFLSELKKVVENMLSAIQTEQVLNGES